MKQETLTVEQFRTLAEKQKSDKNKYNAHKRNGYDSEKEYDRAQKLKLMQRAGVISHLREQVPFVLIPAQYGECGKDLKGRPVRICLEKPCKYIADFVYTDNETGQKVVEDTKGVRTKDYIIKRKLMLKVHGIVIKEV